MVRRGGRPATFEADPRDTMSRPMMSVSNSSGWNFDPQTGEPRTAATELENLRQVFGNPNKTITTSVGDSVPVENDDYLDAFTGRSKHTEQLIERVIHANDMSIVTEVLPFERMDGIDKTFKRVKMNNHLLRNAPEETGPHLVTHTQSSSTISMDRRDIGAAQEKGFWNTQFGREMWAAQLRQIGNAVKETAVLSAYQAIFGEDHPDEDPNESYRVRNIDATDMAKLIAENTSQFGALNKRCAEIVFENAQRIMQSRQDGVSGNYALFPFGSQKYFEGPLFNRKFIDTGHPIESSEQAIQRMMGKSVYREARGLKVGDGQPDLHLESQTVEIGNFFVMNNRGIQNVAPEQYRTSMENVMVYDESMDRNTLVKKMDAFFYAGLSERPSSSLQDPDAPSAKPLLPLSKFGRIFFGRYRNLYDFFAKNDSEQYWLRTILSKNSDIQAEFARFLYNLIVYQRPTGTGISAEYNSQLIRISTAGRMTNAQRKRSQKKAQQFQSKRSQNMQGHMTGDPFSYLSMQDSEEEEDENDMEDDESSSEDDMNQSSGRNSGGSKSSYDQRMKQAVEGSSWSQQVKDSVMSFFGYLGNIQHKFPMHQLTEKYCDTMCSMSHVQDIHIDTATWDLMSKSLLEVDEWQSARQIVTNASQRAEISATPFEETFVQMFQEEMNASNAGKLRDASKSSPFWKSRDNGAVRLSVLAVPGDYDSSTRPLVFPALSYTLSTTHLVLFSVEDDVLQQLRESGGKINIANSEAGSDLRDGLLQYSVTLSAIYQLIADAPHNQYSKSLAHEITKLVNRRLSSSNSPKIMAEVAEYVKRKQLKPLFAQMWASRCIQLISTMLHSIYTSKKGSKLNIESTANEALREITACCTSAGENCDNLNSDDESEDEQNASGMTGARMSGQRGSQRGRMHTGDHMTSMLREYIRVQQQKSKTNDFNSLDIPRVINEARMIVQEQISKEYPVVAERRGDSYVYGNNQEAFERLAAILLLHNVPKKEVSTYLGQFSQSQKARAESNVEADKLIAIMLYRLIMQSSSIKWETLKQLLTPGEPTANQVPRNRYFALLLHLNKI